MRSFVCCSFRWLLEKLSNLLVALSQLLQANSSFSSSSSFRSNFNSIRRLDFRNKASELESHSIELSTPSLATLLAPLYLGAGSGGRNQATRFHCFSHLKAASCLANVAATTTSTDKLNGRQLANCGLSLSLCFGHCESQLAQHSRNKIQLLCQVSTGKTPTGYLQKWGLNLNPAELVFALKVSPLRVLHAFLTRAEDSAGSYNSHSFSLALRLSISIYLGRVA